MGRRGAKGHVLGLRFLKDPSGFSGEHGKYRKARGHWSRVVVVETADGAVIYFGDGHVLFCFFSVVYLF